MASFTTDGKICIKRDLTIKNSVNKLDDLITRYDINDTCRWITDNNFSKVCLQFPDDLLSISARLYEEIKSRVDVDLYILGDTTYASCCVDAVAATHVQGDAVVHYGRSCFTQSSLPVLTVLPKGDIRVPAVMNILRDSFSSDDNDRLCLFYDAEFEHDKDEITKHWYRQYPRSYVAHVEMDDRINRFLARVIKDVNGEEKAVETLKDCICIYIGSRGQTLFNYTISIAAADWYLLEPDIGKVERMDETAWFKRRRYLVERCRDARAVAVLVCELAGHHTKDIISHVKHLCRVNGKKSYIVSVGKPNVAKLANFPEIDIYVMIACPENDLYSSRDFYKPIVYPFELEVALNSNRDPYFSTHVPDYDDLLPGKRYYCHVDRMKETDVSLITGKIRETKVEHIEGGMEIAEKQNWALESIGQNLHDRSWKGLEQKLGETEVKLAEEGRKGIPLHYRNEPE